jgi:hypothetical protein
MPSSAVLNYKLYNRCQPLGGTLRRRKLRGSHALTLRRSAMLGIISDLKKNLVERKA